MRTRLAVVSCDKEVVKIEYISYFVHIMYGPGHTPALTTHGFCVTQSGQGYNKTAVMISGPQPMSHELTTTAEREQLMEENRKRLLS